MTFEGHGVKLDTKVDVLSGHPNVIPVGNRGGRRLGLVVEAEVINLGTPMAK